MGIYSAHIHGVYPAVSGNIGTFKPIVFQGRLVSCMGICQPNIHGIHPSIPVYIPFQVDFGVLGYIVLGYCYGVFAGDMVVFYHLHGVTAGGDGGDVVGGGVAMDYRFIGRL